MPNKNLTNEFRKLINTVNDSREFAYALKNKPTKQDLKIAEKIFAVKNNQNVKQFITEKHLEKSLKKVITPDKLEDLLKNLKNWMHIAHTDCPILLLPVRIETKFRNQELLVRIYPDQIAVKSHEERLTEEEREAGKEFSKKWNNGNDEQKKDAWRELASRLGSARAAWIAKIIDTYGRKKTEEGWAHAPGFSVLPDRFAVYAYVNSDKNTGADSKQSLELYAKVFGKKIDKNISIISPRFSTNNNDEEDENELIDEKSKWIVDFEDAVEQGMAVKIKLKSEDEVNSITFARIVVVGIKNTSSVEGAGIVKELFENHHYTEGFAFLSQGTPTNNTQDVKSPYSENEDDYEESYKIEMQGHREWEYSPEYPVTNAERFGHALGLSMRSDILRYIDKADDNKEHYARAMHTAIWPATGDYFLRYMMQGVLSENARKKVYDHFREFVRGAGPLPSILIGDQPYGILPVTMIHPSNGSIGWDPSGIEFDKYLFNLLHNLYKTWAVNANDSTKVPTIGRSDDPEAEFMQVLSMQPGSNELWCNRFVDKEYNAVLSSARLQIQSQELLQKLISYNLQLIEKFINRLKELMGEIPALENVPIKNILSWKESTSIGNKKPIVQDPEKPTDNPLHYLEKLADNKKISSNTLFFELLQRSLILCDDFGDKVCVADLVREAIRELASCGVLDFFNNVTEEEQIMQRIKDDPNYGKKPPTAFGIGKIKAKNILKAKKRLPGKRFTSLEQINTIKGVGPDTFNDILFSFKSSGPRPDHDLLLRQALDVCSHRLDAWFTSLATKRLCAMRKEKPYGLHIGAYGYIENLMKPAQSIDPSHGYIHAPSSAQARTAAVLYSSFLTHKENYSSLAHKESKDLDNPFAINLSSERARKAMQLWNGVRVGQDLSALLGFQFERALHDNKEHLEQYKDDFREAFSIAINKVVQDKKTNSHDAIAARMVTDGLVLARAWQVSKYTDDNMEQIPPNLETPIENVRNLMSDIKNTDHKKALEQELDKLVENMDALGDLVVTESVYQALLGNYERSNAALQAAAAGGPPPEIHCLKTPVNRTIFDQKVCILFELNDRIDSNNDPRGAAEPRLSNWFGNLLEDLKHINCIFRFESFDNRVNINMDDINALQEVTGIGPEYAQKIITYRQANPGCFIRIKDLNKIDGIGPGSIEKIRPGVTTGNMTVSLSELGLNPLDVLYLSSAQPGGGATEIEQHVAYFVRKEFGLLHDTPVTIMFYDETSDEHTIDQAIELGKTILKLFGKGQSLGPDTFHHPAESEMIDYTVNDVNELKERVDNALTSVKTLLHKMQKRNPKEASILLLAASRFGIHDAVPEGIDDPIMEKILELVQAELNNRYDTCRQYRNSLQNLLSAAGDSEEQPNEQAIKQLIKAIKALFGEEFIVLPPFNARIKDKDKNFIERIQLLPGLEEERIRTWLQQAAYAHDSLECLEDVFMYSEAWKQSTVNKLPASLSLSVCQLPYDNNRKWMALSDKEAGINNKEYERPDGIISIAIAKDTQKAHIIGDSHGRLAGITVDKWHETIPHSTVNTGVSFQYNAPNTQAPQCLLLAVPGKRDINPKLWSEDDLVQIVNDTMDLAKIRAVDTDAMPALGNLIPALWLPADPEKPEYRKH